jgi:ABC-type sugar transport system ATPase subunit
MEDATHKVMGRQTRTSPATTPVRYLSEASVRLSPSHGPSASARIMIMDEPTAARASGDRGCDLIRQLKNEGIGIF